MEHLANSGTINQQDFFKIVQASAKPKHTNLLFSLGIQRMD